MNYALCDKTLRILPEKGKRALCPTCKTEVLAKCGEINIWHWAHVTGGDCDPWSESESLWHRNWKLQVPIERREVTMANHRADILGRNNTVIELQHSSITPKDIEERELFYKNMIWLIDLLPFAQNVYFKKKEEDSYWTFRWYHARKYQQFMKKPLFWDIEAHAHQKINQIDSIIPLTGEDFISRASPFLGYSYGDNESWYRRDLAERASKFIYMIENPIFSVRKIHSGPPCRGWGYFMTKKEFTNKYF